MYRYGSATLSVRASILGRLILILRILLVPKVLLESSLAAALMCHIKRLYELLTFQIIRGMWMEEEQRIARLPPITYLLGALYVN